MFYRLILIFILATLPCEGTSGPRLHEKGSSFTAVSLAATYTLETTTQTYIEYGFSNQMTLIGDINLARRQYLPGTGAATFSFRRALSAADAPAPGVPASAVASSNIPIRPSPKATAASIRNSADTSALSNLDYTT